MFVAGEREGVDALVELVRAVPGLGKIAPKYSESAEQPFNRMLVRIKKEIISFGVAGIEPGRYTSTKLKAAELKSWLDEGRTVTLLDTRNDYEVKLGTFKNATHLNIHHFRQFPDAVRQQLPSELKQRPIVMFCTGGIRCEKAGPFMENEGFEQIYQLDGGILKYFEECGSAHYDGECFVFDRRVGVDPALQETSSAQCFACLAPLTEAEQLDPRFQPPKSCPYCFQQLEQTVEERIQHREALLRQLTQPLPGSTPYRQKRPIAVPVELSGAPFIECLSNVLSHIPLNEHAQHVAEGKWFEHKSNRPASADEKVKVGERYYFWAGDATEPDVAAEVRIVHEDEALLVVCKPAPLPVHPSGRFNKNTLMHFLQLAYHPQKPRPAHRLDSNTRGLLVWTRTRHFARLLQPQFQRGAVNKLYTARIIGHPGWTQIRCESKISKQPVDAGGRDIDEDEGLEAITEFTLLEPLLDGTSWVHARPITGRTNQIRVHLWDLGHPIVGDPLYLANKQLGEKQTVALTDPPMELESSEITFIHPTSKQRVTFRVPQELSLRR